MGSHSIDEAIHKNKGYHFLKVVKKLAYYCYILLPGLVIFGYDIVASVTTLLNIGNYWPAILFRAFRVSLAVVIISVYGKKRWRWAGSFFISGFVLFWVMYLVRIYIDALVVQENIIRPPADYLIALETFIVSFSFLFATSRKTLWKALVSAVYTGTLTLTLILVNYTSTMGVEGVLSVRETAVGYLGSLGTGYKASVLLLLSLFLFFNTSRKISQKLIIYSFPILISLLGMAISTKRGPFLSFAIGYIGLFISGKQNTFKDYFKNGLTIATTFAVLYLVYSNVIDVISYLSSSYSRAFTLVEQGAFKRVQQAKAAYEQFATSPILGDKLTTDIGGHPHNVTFEAFMALGLVGGSIWLFVLVSSLRKSFELRHNVNTSWILPLLLVYVTASHLSGAHWGSIKMWSIIAISFAYSTSVLTDNR